MKKFHLFYWSSYDAGGGFFDYQGSFCTVEEAKAKVPFSNDLIDESQILQENSEGDLVIISSGELDYLTEKVTWTEWKDRMGEWNK